MTLDEFERLATVWGSDIGRWPKPLQDDAVRVSERDDAKAILAQTAAFDRMMFMNGQEVSERRAERIAEQTFRLAL